MYRFWTPILLLGLLAAPAVGSPLTLVYADVQSFAKLGPQKTGECHIERFLYLLKNHWARKHGGIADLPTDNAHFMLGEPISKTYTKESHAEVFRCRNGTVTLIWRNIGGHWPLIDVNPEWKSR